MSCRKHGSRPAAVATLLASWLAGALIVAVSLCACGERTPGQLAARSRPPARSQLPADSMLAGRHTSAAPVPARRVYALLINGGGEAARNYQSHMLHIRELVELLASHGVDRGDIVVFASDGEDPAPDLAVLDEKAERHFGLIEGLPIGARLRPEIHLIDSSLPDVRRRPATRAAISEWFRTDAQRMEPGSVLIVYVTDHGHRNSADDTNNSIVLWGEQLSVQDLRALLKALPAGVQTVMLMSQCFSGSFANVLWGDDGASVIPNVCGFFSSPPDRYAYGCYPENRGKENVGHSFQFFEALRVMGSFDRAHDSVLVTDDTPDVPERTSGHYLAHLLRAHARGSGLDYDRFADRLLQQAWGDEIHYADDFARIDEIGRQFGAFGPRSLAELSERTKNLPELRADLDTYAQRWRAARLDLERENLERFLAARHGWAETLSQEDIEALGPRQRRRLRRELLGDLARFTGGQSDTEGRLKVLRSMAREARQGAYRMEVRVAAALRMRDLLGRIAGEAYLDRYATDAERAAYEGLSECEAFALPPGPPVLARVARPPAFPGLEAEAKLLAAVLPGWLGLEFRAVDDRRKAELDLDAGAVVVTRVDEGSPAARAGIAQGDIVLGPPEEHFSERNQVREWVMTSMIDQTRTLDVMRDGRVRAVSVRIGAPPSNAP